MRNAYQYIQSPKNLYIVKGATHLFEEPGTLEEVACVAAQWFEKYFAADLTHERERTDKRW